MKIWSVSRIEGMQHKHSNRHDTIAALADGAIKDWFKVQCDLPSTPFYMYYLPSNNNEKGKICISLNAPDDKWRLATDTRINPAWTMEQAKRFMIEIIKTLPIL